MLAFLIEYSVAADLHAWVVVFILPVNSAVNPLLYTFTTPKFRERLNDGWFAKVRDYMTRRKSSGKGIFSFPKFLEQFDFQSFKFDNVYLQCNHSDTIMLTLLQRPVCNCLVVIDESTCHCRFENVYVDEQQEYNVVFVQWKRVY